MDPRAALYRGVSDGELLRRHRLFVAEGRLVVRRVMEDARYRLHSLLVNEAARSDLADAIARVPPYVPVFQATADEFRDLTGFNIHRGCLALVHRPPALSLEHVLNRPGPVVMLESVANADNVGGVFRNAAAFGAAGVILDDASADPLYRKAVRTSMAAVLGVPFVRAPDWPDAIHWVRRAGFRIAALTPQQPSIRLIEFVRRERDARVAFVLGAEGAGLSAHTLAASDVRVSIQMANGMDSLNVAVAAGIALFAIDSLVNHIVSKE